MNTELLVKKWQENKCIIIGYNYDTLFNNNNYVHVEKLLKEINTNCKVYITIITTVGTGTQWCIANTLKDHHMPFTAITNEIPVDCSIYLDDRAGLDEAYKALKEAYEIIKKENEYVGCTNDPYVYIKELLAAKEKNDEIQLPDISLLLQFKLFMFSPIAIYKGLPLEAVARKIPYSKLEEALDKFSVLYTISKVSFISLDSFEPVEYYRIRGILKEKLQIKE